MRDCDLRFGRWQDVLADVECDALIADPNYGARTHRGHNAGVEFERRYDGCSPRVIDYQPLSPSGVVKIVESWSPRTRGWFAVMTSHDLVPHWEAALDKAGRYTFAPLPVIDRGSRVRLQGDGPSSWTVWLIVSRPKSASFAKWGTLPGDYQRSPGDERGTRMGGKPLGVMRAIVRDYSRPGDLVCDPFAGHGTTLLAALMEGRRAVGSERHEETFEAAQRRISQGYTPDMFSAIGR